MHQVPHGLIIHTHDLADVFVCPEQSIDMRIRFEKEYLADLYYEGKTTDKKHRYQPDVIKRYRFCVDALKDAVVVEDLYDSNGLHYEVLKGDKKGLESIRVNNKYRIEFKTQILHTVPVAVLCDIIALSNHYK
jgi:proteic killer suppression protein